MKLQSIIKRVELHHVSSWIVSGVQRKPYIYTHCEHIPDFCRTMMSGQLSLRDAHGAFVLFITSVFSDFLESYPSRNVMSTELTH